MKKEIILKILRAISLFIVTTYLAYYFYKKFGNDPYGYLNHVRDASAKKRFIKQDYSYLQLLKDFITLNWHTSYQTKESVKSVIFSGILNTSLYVIPGIVISYLLAPFLGIIISTFKNKYLIKISDIILGATIAVPILTLTYIIIALNNVLNIFPRLVDSPYSISELFMPWLVVMLTFLPYWVSLTRSNAVQLSEKTPIKIAKIWGVNKKKIFKFYYFKQLISNFKEVALIDISYALGGIIVIEYAFSIKGMASIFLSSAFSGDLPLFMVWLFISTIIFLVLSIFIRQNNIFTQGKQYE